MNNAQRLVRILENAGVRWLFGVPSGPVLPVIDALRESSIEFVLTASETSAAFMASAVGYLTGVPGACVSTLGPGATNLATGIGCAWLDRAPVLAITCNVATPWLERRVQMRIDHHALFRPLTKASLPLRRDNIGRLAVEALALAAAEPPGPVHLDLPEDVAEAAAATDDTPAPARPRPPAELPARVVDTVAAALARSRRPLLVTGLGFTRCRRPERLLPFVERQGMPFVTTLQAKGFLPENHPCWAGVIGRARRSDVQALVRRCDLVIAVGYDPVEINYEEWASGIPLIHLSTETAESGTGLAWVCNEACDLDRAIAALSELPECSNDWSAEELRAHRDALERALRPAGDGFAPHEVIDVAREKFPPDAVLACDVGAHTHQIASQWRVDLPRSLLATNGWSSMGYGMPAAYAAKLVDPRRPVLAIVGDGGFQMTVGELAFARRLKLAVPVIVLNDGWLGLMKVKQERRRYSLSGVFLGEPPPSPPHYFGVPCRSARDAAELAAALDWAREQDGPSVIEAFVSVESYSLTVFD
ncbi:MAG TPA: thiamine pyrophosphate-binding protein [candidate division Zixibacteria bacterium]|nr:thiamine pyrophosphate-binding protein [candidate division Zixibacteria bacterium]